MVVVDGGCLVERSMRYAEGKVKVGRGLASVQTCCSVVVDTGSRMLVQGRKWMRTEMKQPCVGRMRYMDG